MNEDEAGVEEGEEENEEGIGILNFICSNTKMRFLICQFTAYIFYKTGSNVMNILKFQQISLKFSHRFHQKTCIEQLHSNRNLPHVLESTRFDQKFLIGRISKDRGNPLNDSKIILIIFQQGKHTQSYFLRHWNLKLFKILSQDVELLSIDIDLMSLLLV